MAPLSFRMNPTHARALAVALSALACASCATTGVRRFPLAAIVWEDPDQRTFSPRPAGFYSPYMWDGADNAFFRPASEVWQFEPRREAINVNAVDEVPDSSWFTNRIGRGAMSVEEVAAGACGTDFAMPEPWTIVGGKPDGANPGFTIVDANGVRYLMKTEGPLQPWRPGAADTIGAAIWYATGYYAPCNQVVHFDPAILQRDPEATIEHSNGTEEPLTEAHVQRVLDAALRLPDGRYRASVSRFIEGRPISAWRYEGVREDDPNDVVPHQHRREVRGMYVLSAWLNHIDSRAENNFDEWVTTDGERGYVRHYILDVGDSFGLVWDRSDELTRRFGHSHYLDPEHIVVDLLSLGLVDRPYHASPFEQIHPVFTYYRVDDFVPDAWRNGYPNPGFERHTEHDAAWMARVLSQLTEEHLRTLVATGRFSRPAVASDLVRILRGRQRKILERYLTRLSPLAFPQVVSHEGRAWLCMRDLAVESGIRAAEDRGYRAVASSDWPRPEPPFAVEHRSADGRVCARLPGLVGASEREPRYLVVDVTAATAGRETTGAASVHLYQTGPDRYRVVGLRRPHPR